MTEQQTIYKVNTAAMPEPPEPFPTGWMEANGADYGELPELWDLWGTIPEYQTSAYGRIVAKNQPVAFFVSNRPKKLYLPYPRMIAGYYDDPDNYYPAGYLDESFTPDELAAFATWMQEHYPEVVLRPKKIQYPIAGNIMGVGANPVGGPTDFIMLSKSDDYDLPFEVWFYRDLRNAEEAAHADSGEKLSDEEVDHIGLFKVRAKRQEANGAHVQERQNFLCAFEYDMKDLVTMVIDDSATVQDLIETCREWTDYYADELHMINVRFVEVSRERYERERSEAIRAEEPETLPGPEMPSNLEELRQAFFSVYGRGLRVPFRDWFDSLRPGQKRRVSDDFNDFAFSALHFAPGELGQQELKKLAERAVRNPYS